MKSNSSGLELSQNLELNQNLFPFASLRIFSTVCINLYHLVYGKVLTGWNTTGASLPSENNEGKIFYCLKSIYQRELLLPIPPFFHEAQGSFHRLSSDDMLSSQQSYAIEGLGVWGARPLRWALRLSKDLNPGLKLTAAPSWLSFISHAGQTAQNELGTAERAIWGRLPKREREIPLVSQPAIHTQGG